MAALHLIAALTVGVSNCSCNYEHWVDTVKATEALVVEKPSFIVPKEAVERTRGKTCAIVTFEIDEKGVPKDIKIEESSRNRVVDMAAKLTAERYRFSANNRTQLVKKFALYFEYPGAP